MARGARGGPLAKARLNDEHAATPRPTLPAILEAMRRRDAGGGRVPRNAAGTREVHPLTEHAAVAPPPSLRDGASPMHPRERSRRTESSRVSRRMAVGVWAVWAASIALIAVGAVYAFPGGANVSVDAYSVITSLTLAVATASLVTSGAVLATRVRGNRVGWLLWAGGAMLALGTAASSPVPAGTPGAVWLTWLTNVVWVPGLMLVALFAPLYFPTGRLPSPRWRAVVAVSTAAIACSVLHAAFGPFDPASVPPGMQNPLAVTGALADLLTIANVAATLTGIPCLVLVAASLVLRYRRAAGEERAQLRWFAAGAALTGLAISVSLPLGSPTGGVALIASNLAWLLLFLGLALLPASIAVAVLRYRLYEIDRLLSRTVAYAILTVLLASVFGATVLVLQGMLAPFTGSNALAVAGSTLIGAGLFQPVRRRISALVDRRFNRAGYDAERTLALLGARLRREVDAEAIATDLRATVTAALEPASVNVWLR